MNTYYTIAAIGMTAGVATLALIVREWLNRKAAERSVLALKERGCLANEIALDALRKFWRSKLLAGGYGGHYAYHVTSDGLILRVDVKDYYLALFARMYDFWNLVATEVGVREHPSSVSMDEIECIDGECDFTRIDSGCGETYVDTVFPSNLPYAYLATRMTADEFKKAVVERKAEAAKRRNRDYDIKG